VTTHHLLCQQLARSALSRLSLGTTQKRCRRQQATQRLAYQECCTFNAGTMGPSCWALFNTAALQSYPSKYGSRDNSSSCHKASPSTTAKKKLQLAAAGADHKCLVSGIQITHSSASS
jgi:hypothetical protein